MSPTYWFGFNTLKDGLGQNVFIERTRKVTDTLKLRFLGAAGQVERSATLITVNGSKLLLDYGVQLKRPPLFPLHVSPRELSGIAVSHAHLDHSGATPFLYISGVMSAYTTPATMDLIDLLIKDFLKISGPDLPFEFVDLQTLESKAATMGYRERVEVPHSPFTIEFLNAGHVPGASQILVDTGSKRILYTGDINSYETHLQAPADFDYGDVDVVISESTYAGETHPERDKHEEDFAEKIRGVLEDGGIALIPTFAIGRSQEILLMLVDRGFDHEIFMDGMAVTASDILIRHPTFLRDAHKLERALRKVNKIYEWKQRRRVVRDPCVIIAPAGMLSGGAAVFYMRRIHDDPRSAIFVVGFQSPGTPGRTLVEEKRTFIRGKERRVRAEVHNYRFSSHIDHRGFEKMFKNIRVEPIVFVVHGDPQNLEALAGLVSEEIGLEAYVPRLGEEFEIGGSGVVGRSGTRI